MNADKQVVIAKGFESSKRTTVYETILYVDGDMSCSCPGWIYAKEGKRECKHTKKFDALACVKETIMLPELVSTAMAKRHNWKSALPEPKKIEVPCFNILEPAPQNIVELKTGVPLQTVATINVGNQLPYATIYGQPTQGCGVELTTATGTFAGKMIGWKEDHLWIDVPGVGEFKIPANKVNTLPEYPYPNDKSMFKKAAALPPVQTPTPFDADVTYVHTSGGWVKTTNQIPNGAAFLLPSNEAAVQDWTESVPEAPSKPKPKRHISMFINKEKKTDEPSTDS